MCVFVFLLQGDISQQEKRAVFLSVHDLGTNRKFFFVRPLDDIAHVIFHISRLVVPRFC